MSSKDNLQEVVNLDRACLLTAPWVVPVSQPPLQKAGLVVENGKILKVGLEVELNRQFPNVEQISCPGLLMPALINAHTHLELSHLAHVARPGKNEPMVNWIEDLLMQRQKQQDLEVVHDCMNTTLRDHYEAGCILLCDIGNSLEVINSCNATYPEVLNLLEVLGPTQVATTTAIATIDALPKSCGVTAHAPYSTSPSLLQYIKKRCRATGALFSIHIAESAEELEFVGDGSGAFKTFLEKRGAWDGTFANESRGDGGVIHYLDELGLLDENTLCVHCVHIDEDDIHLLAKRGASVCLCPGSNRFLRVGKAPVPLMLQGGLSPALGTDSISSNWTIDLWREMQIMAMDHPELKASKILEMATLGGAQCLQRQEYGALDEGKCGSFLNITDPRFADIEDSDGVLAKLVTQGRPDGLRWFHSH